MNNLQISNIFEKIHLHNGKFLGVYSSDTIPNFFKTNKRGNDFSLIVNTDPSSEPGEHWVAFYIPKQGIVEYFDSFGREPNNSNFSIFLKNTDFLYNNIRLQSVLSNVCGQYCIFYILARHFNLDYADIIHLFSNNHSVNDNFVNEFINDLFSLDLQKYDIDFIGKQISRSNILCKH